MLPIQKRQGEKVNSNIPTTKKYWSNICLLNDCKQYYCGILCSVACETHTHYRISSVMAGLWFFRFTMNGLLPKIITVGQKILKSPGKKKQNSWNQINQNFFSWNCIFDSFKLFPSSKIYFWPFLKLQKWNWFIWFHEFCFCFFFAWTFF